MAVAIHSNSASRDGCEVRAAEAPEIAEALGAAQEAQAVPAPVPEAPPRRRSFAEQFGYGPDLSCTRRVFRLCPKNIGTAF